MEVNRRQFKKKYPNLAKELENNKEHSHITSFRSDVNIGEKTSNKKFETYIPDVIDFIRRCDNQHQAMEIINYLEKRKEITLSFLQSSIIRCSTPHGFLNARITK